MVLALLFVLKTLALKNNPELTGAEQNLKSFVAQSCCRNLKEETSEAKRVIEAFGNQSPALC